MPNLENYIKDHLDEFDSNEPDPGHFRRFEERLTGQPELKPSRYNRSLLLRVAAMIVVLISVSVFVFDFTTREIRQQMAAENKGSELPLEIREAVDYYENQTRTQLATLDQLTKGRDDAGAVSTSALKDIQNLDATTDELKKSLAKNPGNERIFDAIIQNQRMKETMLNTIINQLSLSKK